ncbi:nucleotide sugar dehydrogenase [Altererythrobacter sp.]|uniref:nucleotide sugar dehydrogenase n=1 Tax=Altererythrobacter sp. TaxID=1872480 RepID=UPI003D050F71
MSTGASGDNSIVVIGLGYVGLPLAIALADRFEVTGFDTDARRVGELEQGYDRTGEIDEARLSASPLYLVSDPSKCPPANFYIVAVPTPIDAGNNPDLSLLKSASRTVGPLLKAARAQGRIPAVIYESTVYPGVTEDICGPILEESSGLTCREEFFLAYSPERINPGDREHTVDKITKVVSGQTPEVLDKVAALYGAITSGGVFRAQSIKAAEAAKVIENAQRDINIAFMNEIAQIFGAMDLSVWDVLDAARTKWNFLPFSPGLVGGHCIGVDPYYLAHRAEQLGHDPKVILAGRGINDGMAGWIADRLHSLMQSRPAQTLILGVTFKEDLPDLRNSKVFALAERLRWLGHSVTLHDPRADPADAKKEYGVELDPEAMQRSYDLVVLAVPHKAYIEAGTATLRGLLNEGGRLADIKGVLEAPDWTL